MNTATKLLLGSLIGISTFMPSQVIGQTTTTNCTDWYGDIRCTSRTRPNWGQALGQALTEAAERDRQKKLEEEQRQLLEKQYRILEAQEAARNSANAAERTRREAQARLYWSRATDVILSIADSLKFEGNERRELVNKAQSVLQDLLITSPAASSFEIQDNLRPIANALSRNSQAVSDATIKWVQTNKTFLANVSTKERWLVGEVLATERENVISLTDSPEIAKRISNQLNNVRAAIEKNRTFCKTGNPDCKREFLSARTMDVVDSLERLRNKRLLALQRDSAMRQEQNRRRREADKARFTAALPRLMPYAGMEPKERERFVRAIEKAWDGWDYSRVPTNQDIVSRARDHIETEIDWCKGTVRCDSLYVSDSVYSAFQARKKESLMKQSPELKNDRTVSASPADNAEVTKYYHWEETSGGFKRCYYEYKSTTYALTVHPNLPCPASAKFKIRK